MKGDFFFVVKTRVRILARHLFAFFSNRHMSPYSPMSAFHSYRRANGGHHSREPMEGIMPEGRWRTLPNDVVPPFHTELNYAERLGWMTGTKGEHTGRMTEKPRSQGRWMNHLRYHPSSGRRVDDPLPKG